MISCQVCWRTMRWHNGQIRRSRNPHPSKVFQDWSNKWEESVAHSIVARSLFTPMKAVYICADQPVPPIFRLQLGGGPYKDGCAVRSRRYPLHNRVNLAEFCICPFL
jgi:hypothetical protein